MRPTDKATADSRSVQSFAITHSAQQSLAAPSLGSTSPPLLEQWCGFFYIPQEPDKWKCCETGSTVFRPYSRRLEILTVCRSHYKGITFCQFFNPGCWSCRGLNPRPPVRQIGDFLACSRRSDSGERCEVKRSAKKLNAREGERWERFPHLSPSSPLLFIDFFTSHRSPLSERLEQASDFSTEPTRRQLKKR